MSPLDLIRNNLIVNIFQSLKNCVVVIFKKCKFRAQQENEIWFLSYRATQMSRDRILAEWDLFRYLEFFIFYGV